MKGEPQGFAKVWTALGARGRTVRFAGACLIGVLVPGCGVAAPTREPQAVLQPMTTAVDGLVRDLGGGRIADGPVRVHCYMSKDDDPTVRWRVFARTPVGPATPASVAKAVSTARASGWTVGDRGDPAQKAFQLRKAGVFLTVSYLQNGRGDVVISGETECFVPTGGR